MTGVTLRQAALAAEQATADAARKRRADERAKHKAELLDKWAERATLNYGGDPLPKPDTLTWVGYPGVPYQNGHGRNANVYGWTWTTDHITFVYDASYNGAGLCVILACPDCGERHADHPYGMDGLGKLLRQGRSTSHVCREVATRTLAHAIREAAQATGLDPHTIAADAADRPEAWPR